MKYCKMKNLLLRSHCVLFLILLIGQGVTANDEIPTKPNVLLILADDLGWSDTTLFGTTRVLQDAQHRTTGRTWNDVHARLFGQPAVFADTGQHSDRTQPGPHGHHRAELSPAASRARRRPRAAKPHANAESDRCPNPVTRLDTELLHAGRGVEGRRLRDRALRQMAPGPRSPTRRWNMDSMSTCRTGPARGRPAATSRPGSSRTLIPTRPMSTSKTAWPGKRSRSWRSTRTNRSF